jgi:hypothetical protein
LAAPGGSVTESGLGRIRLSRLKQIVRLSLGAAILVALGVVLLRNVKQVDWTRALSQPWVLALIVLACTGELLLQYFVWWRLLNRRAKLLSFSDGYYLFTVSSLSRYLPAGKLWQVVSFLHFDERPEVGAASLYAYAVSMLCAMLAGALFAAVGAPLLFPSFDSRGAVLVALLLAAGSLSLTNERLVRFFARLGGKRFSVIAEQGALRLTELVVVTALHAVSWLIEGSCALFLMRMVDPSANLTSMWLFLTAYALATFAGYASLLTPAGLGVREGVSVVLLLQRMPVVLTTFVTLTLRCALTVADLVFAVPLAARYISRGSAKTAPSATPARTTSP